MSKARTAVWLLVLGGLLLHWTDDLVVQLSGFGAGLILALLVPLRRTHSSANADSVGAPLDSGVGFGPGPSAGGDGGGDGGGACD